MNWDAIGAVGQAISALALVFVLVQIRHARSESRRALSAGRAEAVRALNNQFLDERALGIWKKATTALETSISPSHQIVMERAKLTWEEAWLLLAMARSHWAYFLQIMPNIYELPAMERYEFEQSLRFHYGANGGPNRIFYEVYIKNGAHPDALRYLDNLLAEPG